MHNLITSIERPKNGVHRIRFYVQSGVDHFDWS